MTKYHHLVLFKLHDGVTTETREKALKGLRELGEGHVVLESWNVNESLDTRKGYVFGEEAIFASKEDFEVFRVSDKHNAVAAVMREISDWWVVDYEA